MWASKDFATLTITIHTSKENSENIIYKKNPNQIQKSIPVRARDSERKGFRGLHSIPLVFAFDLFGQHEEESKTIDARAFAERAETIDNQSEPENERNIEQRERRSKVAKLEKSDWTREQRDTERE